MRRSVTWEDVQQLGRVRHSKGEDQPIWLGGSERGLGCGPGGVPIVSRQVSEASETCASTSAYAGEPSGGDMR